MERIEARHGSGSLREALVRLLPDVPDPDLAVANLDRYCRDGPPPQEIDALQMVLLLLGFSPYLADSLINDRSFLQELLRARRGGPWGVEDYRDDIARKVRTGTDSDPWTALRHYKRRAILRTALRDLRRAITLPEVCRELSCVADALIDEALRIVLAGLHERFGTPQAYDEAGKTVTASMVVLSLGKLGGLELNYSSDVDLLFVYSMDGATSGLHGRQDTHISNKEFFTLAAESLTRGVGRITPEGQIYRVDCGLRPGGNDGDLIMPLHSTLAYYETWARPWERQALIKARPCAGDIGLGQSLMERIEGVIYRETPDPSVIDDVRAMKDKIDAALMRRSQAGANIKLGRGGIREIEFIVQALQILHGGKDRWIRETGTVLALHRLADRGLLSVSEQGSLSAAYTYLREVEHRIQLYRNLQRSTLPSDARESRVLARAMGYRDGNSRKESAGFMADLEEHRSSVRWIYDSVFGRFAQGSLEETRSPDPFLDPMPDGVAIARLEEAGIADPQSVLGGVKAISRLLASSTRSSDLRREFRRVTPYLLNELSRVHNPVRGIRNMERFLASLALDRALLRGFLGKPELVPPLVNLFAGSQPLSSALFHKPQIVLQKGFGGAVTRERDVGVYLQDLEEPMGTSSSVRELASWLRTYQQEQTLYVGLKDLSGQAGPAQVGRALSSLAEAIIRALLYVAARESGWPVDSGRETPGFIVLGLGKIGYRELDYFSDLDLVFAYEEGVEGAERHALANRLATCLVQILASITREGSLYAVDARLRPFGGEGELAQPVGQLGRYFSSTAEVWEMQSFLKARPLAGDSSLGRRTGEELEEIILERASSLDLSEPIRGMKQRLEDRSRGAIDIKQGPGGLSAIQFTIQYLQLRNRVPSPPLKSTTRLLGTLRMAGLLGARDHRDLLTGFRFLRELEHRLRLMHGRAVSHLPSGEALDEIAAILKPGTTGEQLMDELEHTRRRIDSVFRKLIEQSPGPGPSTDSVEKPVESSPDERSTRRDSDA